MSFWASCSKPLQYSSRNRGNVRSSPIRFYVIRFVYKIETEEVYLTVLYRLRLVQATLNFHNFFFKLKTMQRRRKDENGDVSFLSTRFFAFCLAIFLEFTCRQNGKLWKSLWGNMFGCCILGKQQELKKVVDSMQKHQPLCNFNPIFTSTSENFWFGRVVFWLLFWFLSWCHIMSLNAPKFLDHVHGSFKIVLERNREVCFLFHCQHVITKAKVRANWKLLRKLLCVHVFKLFVQIHAFL